MEAGAREVLATLWAVEDRSTATWMSWFYDALSEGRSTAEALASAQRRAIRSREFAHPYYWAGFSLNGAGPPRGGAS